ncbi:hypothetical protein GCM10027299_28890 [Larkinella ripae]
MKPEGDHADFLKEFEDSLYQLVTRGMTAHEAVFAKPAKVKDNTPPLAKTINDLIEQHISHFGDELGMGNTEERFNDLIGTLQDEVTAAFGGKTVRTPKSDNPNAKIVIRVNLNLSLSKNHPDTLSEAELVQMALRKFQYDYTRKLVNYTFDDLHDYAAKIASDLRTADVVAAKLFRGMSNTIELLNNSVLGLVPRAKDVVYSGFEDNVNRLFQDSYLGYNDDPERPGV